MSKVPIISGYEVVKNFADGNFTWDISRAPFPNRSCQLTPECGFEVQNPTQALKSVKGLGNTVEFNPRWEKLCHWEFFTCYL